MRQKIEKHLRRCHRCTAVHDSTRKMLVITGDERIFEVPAGFSERLHGFLNKVVTNSDRAAVAKKGAKYLSGHVDIWVDKFEAIVECDAPNFDAHFLRIAQPPKRLAAANVPDGGC